MKSIIGVIVVLLLYVSILPSEAQRQRAHTNPIRSRNQFNDGIPVHHPHGMESRVRYERTPVLLSSVSVQSSKHVTYPAFPAAALPRSLAKRWAQGGQDPQVSGNLNVAGSGATVRVGTANGDNSPVDLGLEVPVNAAVAANVLSDNTKRAIESSKAMTTPTRAVVGPGALHMTSLPPAYYMGNPRGSRIEPPPSRSVLSQTQVQPRAQPGWSAVARAEHRG